MYSPAPQDAPDPNRPGWVPPASAPLPAYPPAPYPTYPTYPTYGPVYGQYAAPGPAPYTGPRRTSSDATISLICGIAGWLLLPIICPILAIIFGVRAKGQIRASFGALDGGGMATAGIILGVVNLALTILAGLVTLLAFAFLVAGFAAGMAIHGL